MRYKDIMVYVDDNEASGARIRLAAELALSQEAHLTGLYVRRALNIPSPAQIEDESGLLGSQIALSGEFEEKASKLFEQCIKHYNIIGDWRIHDGKVSSALTLHGHYVDLLVLGVNTETPRSVEIVDEAMIVAGRPVLAVPYAYPGNLFGKRAVIAWDGSRESTRAVHDSIPFLEDADKVWVVTAGRDEKQSMTSAAKICAHLSRHDIDAVPESLSAKREKEVGEVILNHAIEVEADLIVMGAYGHTRLHEVILGGVTDHIVNHMTVPVLFSH